jgi:hypothetical protein
LYISAKNRYAGWDGRVVRLVANLENAYWGAMPRVVYESAQTTGT